MVTITYGQCYSEKSADNPWYEDGEHHLRTVLQWEERRQSTIRGWWASPTDSVTVRRAQTIHDMRMVSITYGQCYSEKSTYNPRFEDGEHYLRTVLQWEECRQSTIWGWWALPTDSVTVRRAHIIHDLRMVSITYGQCYSEKSAANPWYEDGEHHLRTVLQWEERRQSTIWGWWTSPTDSVTVRRAQTIHDMRMVSITYGQCYMEKSADNPWYEDGEHYLRTVLQWEERRQSPIWGWWALPTDSVTVRRAQTIHDMRMVSITYGQCYSEKSADNPRFEDGEHYLRTVLQWEERRQSMIWGWWALPTDSVTVRRAQTIHDMRMVSITYGESNSEKSADNPRYEDGEHYLRTVLRWEERRQSTIWGWWASPTDSVTVRRAQIIHDLRMVSITYGQCYSEKSADNPRYEDGEHYLRRVLEWEERRQSMIWGWWASPTDSVTVRRAQTVHDMRMVSITYGQCYSEKSADNPWYEDGEHYFRTVLQWEERRQSTIWGRWASPTDSVTVRRAQTIHDMRMVSITYGQCYSEKSADNPWYEDGDHYLRRE